MSARTAKRWGRWFVFVWTGLWLSAALLPCREVLAAVAVHQWAMHANCEHHADKAPGSGGGQTGKDCGSVVASALLPTARLDAPSRLSVFHPTPAIFASPTLVPPRPALLPRPSRWSAPPPIAVYLQSSRLLI